MRDNSSPCEYRIIRDIVLLIRASLAIAVPMYIESVPNRQSPPCILLREDRREGSKVVKKTLANLTKWPTHVVEGLRVLSKGGSVAELDEDTALRSPVVFRMGMSPLCSACSSALGCIS